MKISHLYSLHTLAFFGFGLVLLFSPETLENMYELEMNATSRYYGNFIAGMYLAFGVTSWLMRSASPSDARRFFLIGLFLINLSISLVMAFATLQQVSGSMGWGGVALGIFLGGSCLYFLLNENLEN